MNKSQWKNIALVAALAVVAPLAARAQSSWLHVQVQENGDKASKVHVNLPLAVAEAALAVVPDKITNKVTEKLSEKDISIADHQKALGRAQEFRRRRVRHGGRERPDGPRRA